MTQLVDEVIEKYSITKYNPYTGKPYKQTTTNTFYRIKGGSEMYDDWEDVLEVFRDVSLDVYENYSYDGDLDYDEVIIGHVDGTHDYVQYSAEEIADTTEDIQQVLRTIGIRQEDTEYEVSLHVFLQCC